LAKEFENERQRKRQFGSMYQLKREENKMTFIKISRTIAALSMAASFALSAGASAGSGYGKLDNWASKANSAVDEVMYYPTTRVRGSGNGNAVFKVTVDRAGDVIASQQLYRPNSLALNRAAKNVLKKADFPALPGSFEQDTLTFELQLSYGVGGSGMRERDLLRPGRVTSRQIAGRDGPAVAALRITPATAE